MSNRKKCVLAILDGWGISKNPNVSAISSAKTPFFDHLMNSYPNAELLTHGNNVGLPTGQMGNSEVGHINIGAGRIVYQELARINKDIDENELKNNPVLKNAFNYAKENNKSVHFLGLVSDGGVHSHSSHLKYLIKTASDFGLKKLFVHAFTDGRDVDPKSGSKQISDLINFIKDYPVKLASLCGRYYAMDRDKRWERTKKAYDLIVNGIGNKSTDLVKSIEQSYENGITDEFIEPIIIHNNDNLKSSLINNEDVVIFFNFRTDRGRQLTEVLSQNDLEEQSMSKMKLKFLTMTSYNDDYKNIDCIYKNENIKNTLGEILSKNNLKQVRIAETEKYPHVTFFFNGGQENPFSGEKRIMCPSPKVATYDLKPEMSAYEITASIIPEIESNEPDFICLNFANPDMVGHTGDFSAAVKACEVVDECLSKLITTSVENNYTIIVIADHGNSDMMINDDGSPNTAHTMNPVPIILVDKKIKKISNGILADIAPTILKVLDLEIPNEMNGKVLI